MSKTYVERLAERDAILSKIPQRRYITNDEFRRQKAALTRAINSGDPAKVLATVEKTVNVEWRDTVWPDDWARWRNALEDASNKARRQAMDARSWEEEDRLEALSAELHAASVLLFR